MSRTIFRVVSIVVVFLGTLLGQNLWAATVAVGPASCEPTLTHFSSIQVAVNAVPPGSTVLVCPGTYQEQVVITQPLTLRGITVGNAGAAVLTEPAGGFVQNGVSPALGFLLTAAQILVQHTSNVVISDLVIDGTGGNCNTGVENVGIQFYFVGVPSDGTDAGLIQHVAVRNVHGDGLCGDGIISENSYIAIESNVVHDVGNVGIYDLVGTNLIKGNTVVNPLDGISIRAGTPNSVISGNTILGALISGIELDGTSATVTNNTIVNPSLWGIFGVRTTNNIITGNHISSVVNFGNSGSSGGPTLAGISLFGSTGNKVELNTFNQIKGGAGIQIIDQGPGGNTVTRNTVNEADCGISQGSAVGDTLAPNTFFNVTAIACL